MFDRFTDRARKIMAIADQQARQWHHEYIGTEHILFALAKEGSGVGANVLMNLGVDLSRVRVELEKLVKPGSGAVATHLPLTPSAGKVLEYAREEARVLGHNYVGSEHLLLGMLRNDETVACQVLQNLGMRLEDVREELISLLGDGTAQRREARPLRAKPPSALLEIEELENIPVTTRLRFAIEYISSAQDAAVRESNYEVASELRDVVEVLRRIIGEC